MRPYKSEKSVSCISLHASLTLNNDPVSQIAVLLIRSSIEEAKDANQQPRELAAAKHILTKSDRADLNYYNREFGFLCNSAQAKARSSVTGAAESPEKASESATISQTLIALAPTSDFQSQTLEGVKLVFIQYENQDELAKQIQKSLSKDMVLAPGTEKVKGISKPSIRYSGPADLVAAQSLQKYLEAKTGNKINDLIDLSQTGYRAPRGQLEVWVK